MPSTPESIEARNWLMENRPDLNITAKGRISAKNMEIFRNRELEPLEEDVVDGEFIDDVALNDTDEVAPKVPTSKPVKKTGRIKKFFTPKAKTTGPKKARVSTELLWELTYGGLSKLAAINFGPAENPQPLLPVSRLMEIQAPAVGIMLDDVVKGTIVDKVAQPLARTGKAGETAWAIVGPPVLVSAIILNPASQAVAVPMLRDALKSYIVLAGPALKKRKEKEEKLIAEMGEQYEGDIDMIIASLFAPVQNGAGNGQSVS